MELLLLLLFLLRVAFLHRRRRPYQRMRLLNRSPLLLLLRGSVGFLSPILRLLHVPVRRIRIAILRLRVSLLLVDSRLRLLHRPYLRIPAVRWSERLESLLALRRTPALRALVAERYDVTDLDAAPAPAADLAAALNQWSAALAADPWLTSWPVLVAGTPVSAKAGWQLAGPPGIALPLLTGPEAIWPLVAISGGTPVTVAGELTAAGLRPLTAWHGGQAVRL